MVVKRIIQAHGGEVNIHSKRGKGTTVGILLPLDERRVRLLEAPSEYSPDDPEEHNV